MAAKPYIKQLMSQADVVVISEHQLYPAQHYKLGELNNDFNFIAKSSRSLNPMLCGSVPGHGGIAILWKQSLSGVATPLKDIGTDRIAVVEIAANERLNIYIVGVYLPQAGCPAEDFEYHSAVLETIIEQCSLKGDVLVIGDFNAHIGLGGTRVRGWGNTSRNGKTIMVMCENQGLVPVDMTSQARGPSYTFMNEQGHHSYIDHCLVPKYLLSSVKNCEIMESILNTSDHLAIGLEFELSEPLNKCRTRTVKHVVAWHKASDEQIVTLYTQPLERAVEDLIQEIDTLPMSKEVLESKLTHVIALIKSKGTHLPTSKYNKHLKSYWNPCLTTLAKRNKAAWRKWVENGRPKDVENEIWNKLKEAKRDFRREQRRQEAKHENQYLERIENSIEIDQKLFWGLINKRTKQRTPMIRPVSDRNGRIARDIDDIANVWKEHFSLLYTATERPSFDCETKTHVDEMIENIDMSPTDSDTVILVNPISLEEVQVACRSLKSGKAAGVDGIQPEHLKHAGPRLYQYLALLFDHMTRLEWRPEILRRGVIVPIPKGKKDPMVPANNRGITLMPVIGKVYDKILLSRSDNWFETSQNEQQGANRARVSSLHTSLVLQETVSKYRDKGETVHVTLLDTQKAFDTVWQNGLFYKLRENNMDCKLWRIIRNTYADFQCSVCVCGTLSDWFRPTQGIHQGDILSMRLYGIFINDLLDDLEKTRLGTRIGPVVTSCPGFADDVAVVTSRKSDMNRQLQTAYLYSCKWRFVFNPTKTVMLTCGADRTENVRIKLNDNEITEVKHSNHLGVPLCTTEQSENEVVTERTRACRKTFYAVQAAASRRGRVDVGTLSKLYWTLCIPKMLYGTEVWQLSAISVSKMEKVHCEVARCIQGLSKLTPRPACHALLGWLSISACIDVRRLIFLLSLLTLPFSAIPNRLAVKILSEKRCYGQAISIVNGKHRSPVGTMYDLARKYGLLDTVHKMLDTGELPLKSSWKQMVKSAVYYEYTTQWTATCGLYSSLHFFSRAVKTVGRSVWWTVGRRNPPFRKQCQTIVKLLTGNHALNSGRQHHVNHTKLCQLCESYDVEDLSHVLFKCESLAECRAREWPVLLDALPGVMATEISRLSNDRKTVLILSGFNSVYIPEWNTAFIAAASYVFKMYRARIRKNNCLQ